jgi:uncharacterized protein (DUF4415 family)
MVLFDPNALTREDLDVKIEQRFVSIGMDAIGRILVPQKGKTRINIYIDNDILEEFRKRADEAGRGYQTMMNEALRQYLGKTSYPIDESTLRRVIREELKM